MVEKGFLEVVILNLIQNLSFAHKKYIQVRLLVSYIWNLSFRILRSLQIQNEILKDKFQS